MDIAAIAIIAPYALIALVVIVIAIRPSSAHAVSEVLKALAGVLVTFTSRAGSRPAEPEKVPAPVVHLGNTTGSAGGVDETRDH